MFRSCSCKLEASDVVKAAVLVVQTVIPRFAIQTTLQTKDLFNHMAKEKALSPSIYSIHHLLKLTNLSLGFSIDRDVPMRVSNLLYKGRVYNKHRRKKIREITITNARA